MAQPLCATCARRAALDYSLSLSILYLIITVFSLEVLDTNTRKFCGSRCARSIPSHVRHCINTNCVNSMLHDMGCVCLVPGASAVSHSR